MGSSPSTQAGLLTSARATAARWRSPPDSSPGLCSRRWPRPTDSSSAFAVAGARPATGVPFEQHRQHHVLERGEFGQQVVELVDEAERAVAQRAARGVRQRAHLLAGDVDLARGRRVEAAEQVQQRALAGAGRAEDRDGLAACAPPARGRRTPACAACLRRRSCRGRRNGSPQSAWQDVHS